jgi:hypothetical protein
LGQRARALRGLPERLGSAGPSTGAAAPRRVTASTLAPAAARSARPRATIARAGNSALAACVASRQARLAALQELLRGLDALGDEGERARIEKLVALVTKAAVEPGGRV